MFFVELTPAAAGAIWTAWLFAVGACVGSFLNVVIYRLPAGKSLVWPGSHCPACQHSIRWHDNVPILSWFVLRGRCRDCASRISFRYPLVEAIAAGLFAVVGVIEGFSGGTNLPLVTVPDARGSALPPLELSQSALLAGYHLVLLTTLLAAGLIEYDGFRPALGLFVPAVLAGCLGPLLWPYFHPASARLALLGDRYATAFGVADAAAGFFLGGLLGLACSWPIGKRSLDVVWGPACVGLFLGWKAVAVLMAATALVEVLLRGLRSLWPSLRPVPPLLWLDLFALCWILAWGRIVRSLPWLG